MTTNAAVLTAIIQTPFGDLETVCLQKGDLFVWEYRGQGPCSNIRPAESLEGAKSNFLQVFDAPGEPVWSLVAGWA